MMGRGGKRPGAGRPRNSGKYKEPTQAVRLPISWVHQIMPLLDDGETTPPLKFFSSDTLEIYKPVQNQRQQLQLYLSRVAAGQPDAACDHVEAELDLNEYLLKHPDATFLVRVAGDSMIEAGIHDRDLLVVDRAIEPVDGSIVIAVINNELTVKRLQKTHDQLFLIPENTNYDPIPISEDMNFQIFGVVTSVIHSL